MFQCRDNLELRYLINGIDMVDALALIQIALMDRTDTNIAGLIIGVRFTPLTNRSGFRASLSTRATLSLIGLGSS